LLRTPRGPPNCIRKRTVEQKPLSPKPEKTGFSLSTSNKIYFGVIAGLNLVVVMAISNTSHHPLYLLGYVGAPLAVFFFLSWAIAWCACAWFPNRKRTGSIVFNVVITLTLLLHAPRMSDSSGIREEQRQIVAQLDDEAAASTLKWRKSCKNIQAPDMLDFSALTSDEEFDRRRRIIRSHIEITKAHKELFVNMVPRLTKRLSVSGRDDPHAKTCIANANDLYLRAAPIFNPLMQTHIEYGRTITHTLDFLQKNRAEWSCENGVPSFGRNSLATEYDKLIETIRKQEAAVHTLTSKLLKTK